MGTINDYYDDAIQRIKVEIESKPETYLLSVEIDELVQYYVDEFKLPLIERDNNREITYEKQKTVLGRYYHREIPLKVFYPIIPDAKMEEIIRRQSSTYYPGYQLDFNNDSVIITIFLSSESIQQEDRVTSSLKRLEEVINWKNNDVRNGNERLKRELTSYLIQKRKQLEADNRLLEEVVKKVPLRLEKRTGATPVINLSVRKVIKPVYPKAKELEEPFLEKDKVDAVIELLKSAGLSFETTPQVYSEMEEEQLRDILLSQLNTVFEGEATGETFIKKGKTDIHLRIGKGSILSMECKFWEGEKNYLSMIDQLFGYLTWRQNYGILITFSLKEGFSSIVEKAKEATLTHHSTMKDSIKAVDESHFVTTNRFPEDQMKMVALHHLFFNLYFE